MNDMYLGQSPMERGDHDVEHDEEPLGDGACLDAIARLMSEEEWNADTIDQVAQLVKATGRVIVDESLEG